MINELLRTIAVRALTLTTLLAMSATIADAAVILRTAPFPGRNVPGGTARCAARNGGTTETLVTVTMFQIDSNKVLSSDALTLSPDDADFATEISVAADAPGWCECSVPSATTFACSFVYINGPITTVVPAQ